MDMALLDVHGFRVALAGWPAVVERVALDFAWFRSEAGAPDRTVEIQEREPDYEAWATLRAAFVTPRNVVYQHGATTIVDYSGRALSVWDRARGRLLVQGTDEHLVAEAVQHFVLSQASEGLEARGLVRLHALGLASDGFAVAVMLPSGGGKSTLALRALADPTVRLLSEDSPLADRAGRLHPFPLRIAVNPSGEGGVTRRRLERMGLHPKEAVEVASFAHRIATGPLPIGHLVIGERSLRRDATLVRARPGVALAPLLRETVVGVGLYQGMEFLLRRGARDAFAQARPAAARAVVCGGLLRRAKVWRLELGRDHDSNWEAVRALTGRGRR